MYQIVFDITMMAVTLIYSFQSVKHINLSATHYMCKIHVKISSSLQ